ncbi:hypothetical protein [Cognaticolwellia mytili]|uniref:hypothetical protein n=1 Tax=Cognaticolwellia mytili TaxID=1888913 RepID=UPI000A175B03|nr:hypothetical protein [Cognaticolwellia mytili]
MNLITDSEIKRIVKKHTGFAIFLVFVPIIFIQLISFFSDDNQLNYLLFYVVPISAVGACAHFIQCVLIDINANSAVNT